MYFILQASLKGFLISAAFTQYYFLFVGLLHLLFSHLWEIPRVNVTVPQETFHAINHQGARCREGHTITTPTFTDVILKIVHITAIRRHVSPIGLWNGII